MLRNIHIQNKEKTDYLQIVIELNSKYILFYTNDHANSTFLFH